MSPTGSEKKKRKDCAFRRQFNEKPSIIPGCPGPTGTSLVLRSLILMSASDICEGEQRNFVSFQPDKGCAAPGCVIAFDDLVCIEKVYLVECKLTLGQTDHNYAASTVMRCTSCKFVSLCHVSHTLTSQPMHVDRNTPIVTAIAALYSQAVVQALQWNVL